MFGVLKSISIIPKNQWRILRTKKLIDDALRLRTLKRIAALDVRIRYGFLRRMNIPSSYRNKKNKIDSGTLYTAIVGDVLEQYLPTDEKEIRIFCDKRSLKGITKHQFETVLKARLLPHCAPDTFIQIQMIDSATSGNIQIADWIAGAFARHLEKGRLDEECYRILKK